jgi:hypothetical protein
MRQALTEKKTFIANCFLERDSPKTIAQKVTEKYGSTPESARVEVSRALNSSDVKAYIQAMLGVDNTMPKVAPNISLELPNIESKATLMKWFENVKNDPLYKIGDRIEAAKTFGDMAGYFDKEPDQKAAGVTLTNINVNIVRHGGS